MSQNTSETTTDIKLDELSKYKTKYRALLFGSLSIILMAIAIVFYENQFSIIELSTNITFDGIFVNNSFLLALGFFILSILFSVIGVIYSLLNKKILGFLLSLITILGICFISQKSNSDITSIISKFNIEKKGNISSKLKVLDINSSTKITDINSSTISK